MATEAVELKTRDGRRAPASAEVRRFGAAARLGRAGTVAVGGLVLGAATVPVPGVHLIGPWLLPLLAFGLSFWVVRIRARVGPVTLTCPACGGEGRTEPGGAVADEAVWLRCPACATPLELVLPEPERPAAG